MQHIRNQLRFNLWYIFLGTFCICAAEAKPIMDPDNAAFNVFVIMFECVRSLSHCAHKLAARTILQHQLSRLSMHITQPQHNSMSKALYYYGVIERY
jgi:hypothetical protein